MTRFLKTTGFRSPGSIAAITFFILWHAGLVLLQPLPRIAEWLFIVSVVGIVFLVPATFVCSLVMHFRSSERRFDYCAPVLALATFATVLIELAAFARHLAIVRW